jgi:hypothetical protein
MSSETEIRPFRVDMPEEAITDLRQRIAAMRWPSKELVADRSQGVQLATLQELARYWSADYDWRACEETLNALPMFKTEIDAVDVHFIHVKSPHENALPLQWTAARDAGGWCSPICVPPASGARRAASPASPRTPQPTAAEGSAATVQ